jgi:transcriptional activator of cad operon
MTRGLESARLEARAMRLLVCLAERPGEVLSIDELLDRVWPDVTVAPDSVYQAIASLRRLLGDDAKRASYIATVPRMGYRLVAEVGVWGEDGTGAPVAPASGEWASAASDKLRVEGVGPEGTMPFWRVRGRLRWLGGAALVLALSVALLVHGSGAKSAVLPVAGGRPDGLAGESVHAQPAQRSLAVLPFLDLTEGMKEEEFADGMTEELIDQLSRIPGLRVPAPTSSFYFKGKQLPVAEMAKTLGVVYVLDGSVRKSGGRVRVAARLARAEDGFVLWQESYDRPFGDVLMVQEDIAGAVSRALQESEPLQAH